MKQTNKQAVFFQDAAGNWFKNQIDLKDVYMRVHSAGTKYGSSADMLLSEMMANVLELLREGRISLSNGLVITDYGCGRSKSANVVGKVLAIKADEIEEMLESGCSMSEMMDCLTPVLRAENSIEVNTLRQIEVYNDLIKVQRYDLGIPEFSGRLKKHADVVFCNDVFEHIPQADLPAFVEDLENAGRYIFASISLRDAVNYSHLEESLVMKGARKVTDVPEDALILEKDETGAYIFSLHVSVLPKTLWQEILGDQWHLLPAQDYTACSAINFEPSADYQDYKKALIAEVGFADFIVFPTPVGTRYESDPILKRRVAMMQPSKHIMKLQTLKEYPESAFKASEKAKSEAFLRFVGLKPDCNGEYHLADLPKDYLSKLYQLEKESKAILTGDEDTKTKDQMVSRKAEELIAK